MIPHGCVMMVKIPDLFYNFINILLILLFLGVLKRLNDITVCIFKEFYDNVITENEFKMNEFYNGAFTFHLHLGNCGKCTIDKNSFFHHIETYFTKKLFKID